MQFALVPLFIFLLSSLSGMGCPAEQWFTAQCKQSVLKNMACCFLHTCSLLLHSSRVVAAWVCGIRLLCESAAGAALTALQPLTWAPFIGSFDVMAGDQNMCAALQCAWFFLEAFPAHCDCLALANVLAFQLKREDSFDRAGSASHDPTNSANGSNSGSGAAESQVEKAMQSDDAPRSESHSTSSCK